MRRGGSRETGSPLLSNMMKRIFLIGVIALLISGMAQAAEKRYEVEIGDSPSIGPADAPVTIIEFIDFQ